MATNPSPDIEVLKNQPKRNRFQFPVKDIFLPESRKSDKPSEDLEEEEEEEWYESPNNFFYERKYLDL